jgi:hypothetical protein
MIIDIAIGIILAVFILRYWPEIFLAIVVASVFAVVGIVVYFVATDKVLSQKISTIAVVLVTYVMGGFVANLIAKRTILTSSEVGILLVIAVFLGSTTVFFFWFINHWAIQSNDPILYLYLLPILAIWAGVWLRLSSLLRSRRIEK